MKIYVLSEMGHIVKTTICVSEDINLIRKMCKAFVSNYYYPIMEIWKNGEKIHSYGGSDVLKAIAREMNKD